MQDRVDNRKDIWVFLGIFTTDDADVWVTFSSDQLRKVVKDSDPYESFAPFHHFSFV